MSACKHSSLDSFRIPAHGCSGRHHNFAKTCVMVLRIKALLRQARFFTSTHNSACTTAAFTRGFDGVLAVKTTFCCRQLLFSIAKNHTVLFVSKRPTLTDELISFLALFGQFLYSDGCRSDCLWRRFRLHQICASTCKDRQTNGQSSKVKRLHPHLHPSKSAGKPGNSKALVCRKVKKNASTFPNQGDFLAGLKGCA